MKFVRWLDAFNRHEGSVETSASWETKQVSRQVAAEPLVRGKSYIHHAKIGLSVAHPEATFARGWLYDAFTIPDTVGILRATRCRDNEFKNMDRFLAALAKTAKGRISHAEATFNAPIYDAVVVKNTASPRGKRRAQRLADKLNLPLRVLMS